VGMKKFILVLAGAGLLATGFTACVTHQSDNSPQPSTQGDGGRGESPGMKAKTSSGSMDRR